jgi:hypothetical protein
MSKRSLALGAFLVMVATSPLSAQGTIPTASTRVKPPVPAGYWKSFAFGFATSILAHEAGHLGASVALGGRPSFGFDKARPTIYSGLNGYQTPSRQFVFSSAGLTMQALLDELILDLPHKGGSAFERGILAGGIGTTAFYLTLGRSGSVSDVAFMARTSGMSKAEISLIYGGIAAMHAVRISRNGKYANFFARPSAEGGMNVGVNIK